MHNVCGCVVIGCNGFDYDKSWSRVIFNSVAYHAACLTELRAPPNVGPVVWKPTEG